MVPIFRGIQNIPPNASLFLPEAYYEHFTINCEHYTKKYSKNQKDRLKWDKQERAVIKTPVPALKHNSCMVCNLRFKEGEYKAHIRSDSHALGVRANDHIYNEIDSLIAEMDL